MILEPVKRSINWIKKYKVPLGEFAIAGLLIGDTIYSSVFGNRPIPDALSYLEVAGGIVLSYSAINVAMGIDSLNAKKQNYKK